MPLKVTSHIITKTTNMTLVKTPANDVNIVLSPNNGTEKEEDAGSVAKLITNLTAARKIKLKKVKRREGAISILIAILITNRKTITRVKHLLPDLLRFVLVQESPPIGLPIQVPPTI